MEKNEHFREDEGEHEGLEEEGDELEQKLVFENPYCRVFPTVRVSSTPRLSGVRADRRVMQIKTRQSGSDPDSRVS